MLKENFILQTFIFIRFVKSIKKPAEAGKFYMNNQYTWLSNRFSKVSRFLISEAL